MKNAGITACTRHCFKSFTLWHRHAPKNQEDGAGGQKKCPVDKNPNRAGATPLFGLSAAQKVFGVAPALGSVSGASDLFSPGTESF